MAGIPFLSRDRCRCLLHWANNLADAWLNRLLFVTLVWFMGNWWMHDNLHMHIALDMNRMLYIEFAFHMSMLACGVTLALSWMRFARHAAAGKPA